MEQIVRYFPTLDATQRDRLAALGALYAEWNERINVVSRQDIGNIYERHVLHSLAIARFVDSELGGWPAGTSVVDVGTGGGFPGIPLAIVYPDVSFLLVDRTGKKIRVVRAVAEAVGLANVEARQTGIEEVSTAADYAVSRAAMSLPDLLRASRRAYTKGLICLKGGDLTDELKAARSRNAVVRDVGTYFDGEFFDTKKIVYIPRNS